MCEFRHTSSSFSNLGKSTESVVDGGESTLVQRVIQMQSLPECSGAESHSNAESLSECSLLEYRKSMQRVFA